MTIPTIVLTSGGRDSAACIAYYRQQERAIQALWVDYRQRAARREEAAVERVAAHYRIPLQKIALKGIRWPQLGGELFEYRGRNLTLAAMALNTAPAGGALVALGIHQGTPFADCDPAFVEQLDQLLALLSDGLVRLDCPFVEWSKQDVARYAATQGAPIDLTYSCERGKLPPCGECVKCRDNLALDEFLSNDSAKRDAGR
ncbi:MAG TPA: 7-cyano-7-deazaguanine synthase [Herpetosiphonaceae bacterium]|nr:7-cyano-7-deazaguanine synthase [Herpetosiphonaceae bacterium]